MMLNSSLKLSRLRFCAQCESVIVYQSNMQLLLDQSEASPYQMFFLGHTIPSFGKILQKNISLAQVYSLYLSIIPVREEISLQSAQCPYSWKLGQSPIIFTEPRLYLQVFDWFVRNCLQSNLQNPRLRRRNLFSTKRMQMQRQKQVGSHHWLGYWTSWRLLWLKDTLYLKVASFFFAVRKKHATFWKVFTPYRRKTIPDKWIVYNMWSLLYIFILAAHHFRM